MIESDLRAVIGTEAKRYYISARKALHYICILGSTVLPIGSPRSRLNAAVLLVSSGRTLADLHRSVNSMQERVKNKRQEAREGKAEQSCCKRVQHRCGLLTVGVW